jgi:hypothetical protein
MEELARRESSTQKNLDPDGPEAVEILRQLEVHGPISPGRLSREVELAPVLLERYLYALESRGRVSVATIQSDRGKRRRVVSAVNPAA